MVHEARSNLEFLYASDTSIADMRLQKEATLNELSVDTQAAIDASGLQVENWSFF